MKVIKDMVKEIDKELAAAEEYAEKYVESRLNNNIDKVSNYKYLAEDRLKAALIVHDLAVKEIEAARTIVTPPPEMISKWNDEHIEYIDRSNHVKELLENN